ncbi:DUF2889 domain-containing protein [Dactylosporangium sucinum]|uniref:DUF2889 domain-containing protein n=1 Tax=Dactylosporangium sucinum TaxID=1424081 RepID=UPI00167C92D1|nr:DUF2889 domain-containing protein [Dactylosporangium sucinum]
MIGRARDLLTRESGDTTVLDIAGFQAEVDFRPPRELRGLRTDPVRPELAGLIGQPTLSGFRRRLDQLCPAAERTLLLHLLDDVPGASLIAGHSQFAEQAVTGVSGLPLGMSANVCAGWRDGGTMAESLKAGEIRIVRGPLAVAPGPLGDPLAWHALPPAAPTMMRRHRLVDVVADDQGWRVDSFLRDSHWPMSGPAEGLETVIHEYMLTARVDAGLVVAGVEVTPRVLPWNECLGAVASASGLVRSSLGEIDARVRQELRGTPACTHLNDVIRSLAWVPTLLATLGR